MKQLKFLTATLGLAAVLGMAGVAGAKAAGAKAAGAKHHGVHGKITALGDNQFTLTTGGKKNPQAITVQVAASTTFMVDGKSASFKDLKTGDRVVVEPDVTNPTKVIDNGQGHRKAPKAAN
jgi:hypothetical protein